MASGSRSRAPWSLAYPERSGGLSDLWALAGSQEAENRTHLKGTAEHHDEATDFLGEIPRALDGHPEADGSARDAVAATAEDFTPLLASMGMTIDRGSRERLATRLVRVQGNGIVRGPSARARAARPAPSPRLTSPPLAAGRQRLALPARWTGCWRAGHWTVAGAWTRSPRHATPAL